ncbi:MAG: hypothetical protein NT133_11010 [Alphaproteobacteria bacterium]|nr:hypothetical protein [Alphaproteobacteria bacterium]
MTNAEAIDTRMAALAGIRLITARTLQDSASAMTAYPTLANALDSTLVAKDACSVEAGSSERDKQTLEQRARVWLALQSAPDML